MSKRFTDSKKWCARWFRTLPLQAKLAWIFLCDECETHGYFKIDYELASFKLGFDFNSTLIKLWFDKKIYFISSDEIVIVPFFEFQYGDSKDTWSAKVRAKEKLHALGFQVINNEVISPGQMPAAEIDAEQPEKATSEASKLPAFEPFILNGIEALHNELYPRKEGLTPAIKTLTDVNSPKTLISSVNDLTELEKAIVNYSAKVKDREEKHIKTFGKFALEWRDWLNPIVGKTTLKPIDGGVKRTKAVIEDLEEIKKNSSPGGDKNFLKQFGAKDMAEAIKKSKKSRGVPA